MSTSKLAAGRGSSEAHDANDREQSSGWARRSFEPAGGSYDPYAPESQQQQERHSNQQPLRERISALAIRGNYVISQSGSNATVFSLSQPITIMTNELILSSRSIPLYKLEYLGDQNSLYIHSQHTTAYPGFGELKLSRHLAGKWWEVKYDDGKTLVLSRKQGRDRDGEGDAANWTRWMDADGQTVATEEDGVLHFSPGVQLPEQVLSLLVAVWTARLWHAETYAGRNGLSSDVSNLNGRSRNSTSSKRRNLNQFVGNLFSGI